MSFDLCPYRRYIYYTNIYIYILIRMDMLTWILHGCLIYNLNFRYISIAYQRPGCLAV